MVHTVSYRVQCMCIVSAIIDSIDKYLSILSMVLEDWVCVCVVVEYSSNTHMNTCVIGCARFPTG